jgi:hypothetical protein
MLAASSAISVLFMHILIAIHWKGESQVIVIGHGGPQ